LQTRWLASPACITELLKVAAPFTESDTTGVRTFAGRATLRDLVADPAGAFFYRPYVLMEPAASVSFTIVTDWHYLPTSFTLHILVPSTDPSQQHHQEDPFTITYRDWSQGQTITIPTTPPTPQWGRAPS
jgi:hypothetical protein